MTQSPSVIIEVELQDIDHAIIEEIMEELVFDIIDEIFEKYDKIQSPPVMTTEIVSTDNTPNNDNILINDNTLINDSKNIIYFLRHDSRMFYMRKIYGLLIIQLIILLLFGYISIQYPVYTNFVLQQGILYLITIILPIIILIFSHFKSHLLMKYDKLPFALFFIFTLCMGYMFSIVGNRENPYMFISTVVTMMIYYMGHFIYTFNHSANPTASTNIIVFCGISLFVTPAYMLLSDSIPLIDFLSSIFYGLFITLFIHGNNYMISYENTSDISVFSYTLFLYSNIITIISKIYEELSNAFEDMDIMKFLK